MKAFLIFCLLAGSRQLIEAFPDDIPEGVTYEQVLAWLDIEDENAQQAIKISMGFRRLTDDEGALAGPCAGFDFSDVTECGIENDQGLTGIHPELNPSMAESNFALSEFAKDWVSYTCCKITKEDMHGIIASVWLWLQVCTQARITAQNEPRLLFMDNRFAVERLPDNGAGTPYSDGLGPLKVMYSYCPTDLDGGALSEWVVATFFPVMEAKNPNFHAIQQTIDTCEATGQSGAVTVLFTEPDNEAHRRSFGHVALVVHDDETLLDLPDDMDQTHFMSWSHEGNTVGAMITGTKALHVGFGQDLQNVSHTLTLYNVNTEAVLAEWEAIKGSGQMFDLMEWNCARTLFQVLNAGYPNCPVPTDELWTPSRAFSMLTGLKERLSGVEGAVPVETIRARHIVAPIRVRTTGVDVSLVVGICLACFFGTLALAAGVATAIIMKIKAEASDNLDRNLANLLISAAATAKAGGGGPLGMIPEEGGTTGPPSKKGKKNSVAPIPLSKSIQQEMDVGTADGTTDYAEFMKWAKEHGFNFKQAKIMWSDLDRDHNNHVTNKEWEKYIDKRPNLKWLATRLQSVARR